jgi:hypothetical protein
MSTDVIELKLLHEAYIAKVNSALEAGKDYLADELSASYDREAIAAMAADANAA